MKSNTEYVRPLAGQYMKDRTNHGHTPLSASRNALIEMLDNGLWDSAYEFALVVTALQLADDALAVRDVTHER